MNRRLTIRCLTVLAAGALLAGAGGCGMLEKPSASITGMKLQNVSMTEATMVFDVAVKNPYTVALPMSNVDYTLTSRGQSFLTGQAELQGTVPAGASKVLPVPVRINFVKLIQVVQGVRPGQTIPYNAAMGLSVKAPIVGDLRVPMSQDGELAIPTGQGLLDRLRDSVR